MDGRVQSQVTNWLKTTFNAEYVDMITEPGPLKILTDTRPGYASRIREKVQVSFDAHGSRVVAVAAHADCAGNPRPKEAHLQQLHEGVNVIRSWGLPVTIVGLWLDCPDWIVEQVIHVEPE
jgi:hypothetical protein